METDSDLTILCDRRCRPLDDGDSGPITFDAFEDRLPHGFGLQPTLAHQRLAAQAVRAALRALDPDSGK
jgi:hypothetical protein